MNYYHFVALPAYLAASIGGYISAADYQELFQRTKPSIFLIQTTDGNGVPQSTGTGFAIDSAGHVITNYHVVENAVRLIAFDSEERGHTGISVLAVDSESDLALLEVSSLDSAPLSLGDPTEIAEGAPVVVIGNPKGIHQVISDGIISSANFPGNKSHFGITAQISPGSSGSPVMRETGRVIGVATGEVVGGQNLNYCVRIETVAAFLKRADLVPEGGDDRVEGMKPPKDFPDEGNPGRKVGEEWGDSSLIEPMQRISSGDYPGAIESIDGIASDSGNATGYLLVFLKGVAHSRIGNHKEAAEMYRESIEKSEDFVEGWYNLGVELLKIGRFEEAERAFREAIDLRPSGAEAWSNLAVAQSKNGNRNEAESSFGEAVRLAPGDAEYRYNLGQLLGKSEEAKATYKKAVELDPNFAAAWAALGSVQLSLEEFEAALESLKKAKALGIDTPEVNSRIAEALKGAGRNNKAQAFVETGGSAVPGGKANLEKARSSFRAGNLSAVVGHLRNVDVDSLNPEDLAMSGFSFYSTGDYKRAEDAYRRLTAADPGDVDAWHGLFLSLREQGKSEEAARAKESYLRLKEE